MNLPTPNRKEVADFKALYLRLFGVELTEDEAWEAATRTLRLFCLCTYGEPKKPGVAPERRDSPGSGKGV